MHVLYTLFPEFWDIKIRKFLGEEEYLSCLLRFRVTSKVTQHFIQEFFHRFWDSKQPGLLDTQRLLDVHHQHCKDSWSRFLWRAKFHARLFKTSENLNRNSSHTFRVNVGVRFRPNFSSEQENKSNDDETNELTILSQNISIHKGSGQVFLSNVAASENFVFTHVFDQRSKQENIFSTMVISCIIRSLEGISGTILCYGPTGSGKTHTIFGSYENVTQYGLFPRMCTYILDVFNSYSNSAQEKKINGTLDVEAIEIYNEHITPLLKRTRIKQHETVYQIMDDIMKRRNVRSTLKNHQSSRSHCILRLFISQTTSIKSVTSTIHLVDLAGSERGGEVGLNYGSSSFSYDAFRESCKINLSLTTLGRVVQSLSEKARHIPFLDSKLTAELIGAFGETNKGSMSSALSVIICCSSSDSNFQLTRSALQFGQRCMLLVNQCNEAVAPRNILEYQELLRKIRLTELEMRHLEIVWEECGEGRHDLACRCNRCEYETANNNDRLPFHMPRYVRLSKELDKLKIDLADARLGLLQI